MEDRITILGLIAMNIILGLFIYAVLTAPKIHESNSVEYYESLDYTYNQLVNYSSVKLDLDDGTVTLYLYNQFENTYISHEANMIDTVQGQLIYYIEN